MPTGLSTGTELLAMVFALITPLLMYGVNYFAPWTSEPIKALVQAVAAAGAGAAAIALERGDFGFNNETLMAVLLAMATALAAHIGYTRGGINVMLGGGRNAQNATRAAPRMDDAR